jgi:hypothetical protein
MKVQLFWCRLQLEEMLERCGRRAGGEQLAAGLGTAMGDTTGLNI